MCDCADSAQYARFQAMATKQADVEWKELVAFMKSVKDAGNDLKEPEEQRK